MRSKYFKARCFLFLISVYNCVTLVVILLYVSCLSCCTLNLFIYESYFFIYSVNYMIIVISCFFFLKIHLFNEFDRLVHQILQKLMSMFEHNLPVSLKPLLGFNKHFFSTRFFFSESDIINVVHPSWDIWFLVSLQASLEKYAFL